MENPEDLDLLDSPDKKWVSPMVGHGSGAELPDQVVQERPAYGDQVQWGNYAASRFPRRGAKYGKRSIFGRII
jgi:hypothetical protein